MGEGWAPLPLQNAKRATNYYLAVIELQVFGVGNRGL